MSDDLDRLAAYFRDEEPDEGRDGDWRDDSTVTTTLRLLRKRRAEHTEALALLERVLKAHDETVGHLLIGGVTPAEAIDTIAEAHGYLLRVRGAEGNPNDE